MNKMTYRKLAEHLSKFTDEELDMDVSILAPDDEFYEVSSSVLIAGKDDEDFGVLDDGHPYFELIG